MHPRVERLPPPDPDYRRFLAAVHHQMPDRVPLIELAVHPEIVDALLDDPNRPAGPPDADPADTACAQVRLLHRLGYDVVKVSARIPFELQWRHGRDDSALSDAPRDWQDQHAGPIQMLDDCTSYPWPVPKQVDFTAVETAAAAAPDGMRLIGFAGGVLEFATHLVGLERFMLAVYDAPDLVAEVCRRVGETIHGVFEAYCQMESVCAIWLGDDLGSKNGLLVSPAVLEAHVFPWFKRYVDLAHEQDKPFLLHSCGKVEAVMPALVDELGIDAKHSFEDAIEPVEHFINRWGDRIGVLGGIDVNLLALGDEAAIAARVQAVLEHAAPRGGYACGSGNSIPNYVPPEHYLTMIETAHRFNGRR